MGLLLAGCDQVIRLQPGELFARGIYMNHTITESLKPCPGGLKATFSIRGQQYTYTAPVNEVVSTMTPDFLAGDIVNVQALCLGQEGEVLGESSGSRRVSSERIGPPSVGLYVFPPLKSETDHNPRWGVR